jgi:DNA-binding IclR family transcriptional regulator
LRDVANTYQMANSSTTAQTPKSSAMGSTLRCLKVLELLAEEPFEMGISELADLLKAPNSSVHRLCATLLKASLIEHDRATKHYRLSPKALWIGSGYLRHSDVYRAAFFAIQDLVKNIPGTVQLGVLDEDWVQFIYSIGYPGSTDAFADVGLRRPLHATASGKLFLAEMTSSEVDKIMSGNPRQFTNSTIVSAKRMKQELEEIAKRGYAINDEELLPGYIVVAAPFFGRSNKITAAISATIPTSEMRRDESTQGRYINLVREAAHRASLQLGHRPLGRQMMDVRAR